MAYGLVQSCGQVLSGPALLMKLVRPGTYDSMPNDMPHGSSPDDRLRDTILALPLAIYTTDASGLITFFNPAAAELAGRTPQIGRDRWCVTWRLRWPDGRPMPHKDYPMAVALRENRPMRGVEAIGERPGGVRF